MSQIPWLNPVDTAPPAGSQEQVVTSATILRLLSKIGELERRITMLERR